MSAGLARTTRQLRPSMQPAAAPKLDFTDMVWLFQCNNNNRGIARLNFDEAALLWNTVKATEGPILEVGRMDAGSTALLCAAAAGRTVVSIDINPQHDPVADAFLNRPEIRDNVELLICDSRAPLPGRRFGMLFIDGDHSYEGVKADVLAHWPALHSFAGKPALAAFHDVTPRVGRFRSGRDINSSTMQTDPAANRDNAFPPTDEAEAEALELSQHVSALRELLLEAVGTGRFDPAIESMLKQSSNGNIATAKLVLGFDQLEGLRHADDKEQSHDPGDVDQLCWELRNRQAAQHAGLAGTMMVLEKTGAFVP